MEKIVAGDFDAEHEEHHEEEEKKKKKKKKKVFVWFEDIECKNSWFIFSQQNCLRRFTYKTIKHEE